MILSWYPRTPVQAANIEQAGRAYLEAFLRLNHMSIQCLGLGSPYINSKEKSKPELWRFTL